jgi:hypothetical protein
MDPRHLRLGRQAGVFVSAALLAAGFSIVAAGCSKSGGGGGRGSASVASTASSFTTSAPLGEPRVFHTSVLLPNGLILVIGGQTGPSTVTDSAEFYDPQAMKTIRGPRMATARMKHAAILLPNNKVLVVGGQSDVGGTKALASMELYDASTMSFTTAPSLAEPRSGPSLALFKDGAVTKVLISGGLANGLSSRTAELYTVDSNTVAPLPAPMIEDRFDANAVTLASGSVLIQGGYSMLASGPRPASSELYDPKTGGFTPTPSVVTRAESTLIAIGSDTYVLGGTDGVRTLDSAEKFDGKAWRVAPANLATSRRGHTVSAVGSKIFVAGGFQVAPVRSSSTAPVGSSALASTEFYGQGQGAPLKSARAHHTTTALPSGQIVVIGGEDGSSVLASIEVYGAPASSMPSPTGTAGPGSTTAPPTSSATTGPGNGNGRGQNNNAPPPPAGTPALQQFSPPVGDAGDLVNLTGLNLDPVPARNVVTFGSVVATVTAIQTNPDHQRMVVQVPASLKTGTHAVTVTVNGKKSNALAFRVR